MKDTVEKEKVTKPKRIAKRKKLITFHESYETMFLGKFKNTMTAKLTPNGVECVASGRTFLMPLKNMPKMKAMSEAHLVLGLISDSVYGKEIVAYVGEDGLCYEYIKP